MGKDVKIGLALGLVVIVVGVVVFGLSGGRGPATDQEGGQAQPPGGARSTPTEPYGPGQAAAAGPGHTIEVTIPGAPGGPGVAWGPASVLGPQAGVRHTETETRPAGSLALGPRAPEGTSASTASGSLVHVVRQGDTLWDLARRYYGNPLLLSKIQEANRDRLLTTSTSLKIGMELVIPDVPASGRAPAEEAKAESGAAATAGAGRETPPAEVDYETYVVRAGDTLSMIAQRFYGDNRLIRPIVEANPRLAANPNRIVVGWQLRIPGLPAGRSPAGTSQERGSARREID